MCDVLKAENSRWALAIGYLQAWQLLHRAEEQALLATDRTEVIDNAYRDELRLLGSNVPQNLLLRRTLHQAVARLDAEALKSYFVKLDGDEALPSEATT